MADTRVQLCGIELDNPIIPCSGTFGYGYEFAELYDINKLGSFSFKGTTSEARNGNVLPRIAECESGLLNSVGLQNPGIDAVIAEEMPKLRACFNKPVMANVSGFSVDEYVYLCERLDTVEGVGWIEVNISCPNVKAGGMSFGTQAKSACEVTRAVRKATTKPIIMKLTPNVTDITEIAKACEDGGADGISLINTVLGMRIDLNSRRPVLSAGYGGMSGSCVLPLALRMVSQVYKSVKLPIVGMGGVSTARDVLEMVMAGATAVGVGAANLRDPYACLKMVEELPTVMEKNNIHNLDEVKGCANDG